MLHLPSPSPLTPDNNLAQVNQPNQKINTTDLHAPTSTIAVNLHKELANKILDGLFKMRQFKIQYIPHDQLNTYMNSNIQDLEYYVKPDLKDFLDEVASPNRIDSKNIDFLHSTLNTKQKK